jgi:hypothetical protein
MRRAADLHHQIAHVFFPEANRVFLITCIRGVGDHPFGTILKRGSGGLITWDTADTLFDTSIDREDVTLIQHIDCREARC